MEKLIYFFLGAMVVLIFWLWRTNVRFRKIRKNFERFQDEIKKTRYEMTLLKGKLKQAESIDLDLSIIEEQEEENMQKLFSFIRQEMGEVNKNMQYLEERMEELEAESLAYSEKLTEAETAIEEIKENKE